MIDNPFIQSIAIVFGIIGGLASTISLFWRYTKKSKPNKQLEKREKKTTKFFFESKSAFLKIIIFWFLFTALLYMFIESYTYTIIVEYKGSLIRGLGITFLVSIIAVIIGTITGLVIALSMTYGKRGYDNIFNVVVRYVIYILLSIPALVFLYGAYFSLNIGSVFIVSVVALSVNLMPFVAKIVANSIENISQDQIDAATAFGYSKWQIAMNFKIGYVVRNSLQPLLVEYYTTIKLSSLAGFIGLTESFHISQDIIKDTQDPISGYIILTLCYVILVSPIALIADYYERKWKSKQFG